MMDWDKNVSCLVISDFALSFVTTPTEKKEATSFLPTLIWYVVRRLLSSSDHSTRDDVHADQVSFPCLFLICFYLVSSLSSQNDSDSQSISKSIVQMLVFVYGWYQFLFKFLVCLCLFLDFCLIIMCLVLFFANCWITGESSSLDWW